MTPLEFVLVGQIVVLWYWWARLARQLFRAQSRLDAHESAIRHLATACQKFGIAVQDIHSTQGQLIHLVRTAEAEKKTIRVIRGGLDEGKLN